jgi:hypothetical protein
MAELSDAAKAFVEGDVTLLPSALARGEGEALVALLVERGDAVRLQKLAEAKDKPLAKLARRGLHVLRTRGAAVPAPEKRTYVVRGPYAKEEVPSLASLIDGRGERIVWFVRLAPDGGGFEVFQAEISESRGLIGFESALAPRKDWRARAQKVLGDARLGVAEIPGTHARWLIEQAYERTVLGGRVAPEGFARVKIDLGPAVRPAEHPALAMAPPAPLDEVRGTLGDLHLLHEIETWVPEPEALQSLDVAIGEVITSRIVVEPAQKMARLSDAVERVADQALTPAWRARLAERLHESALLLASRGKLDEARRANAAAALTLDESVTTASNPFVRRIFDKLINPAKLAAAEEQGPESPLR